MARTWEEVSEVLNTQGWELHEIESKQVFIAICKNGHYWRTDKGNVSSVKPCSYCKGIKSTVADVRQQATSLGLTLKSYETNRDRSGNIFVKKNHRIEVVCEAGHVKKMSVQELFKGKTCTTCSGTRASTAYSRSEEIIAGVLDHVGVRYIRQAVTDTLHEQLHLDFILPEHKTIIEYDGAHHKYGRTSDRDAFTLEEIRRTDKVRDAYAEAIGFAMERIDHNHVGKKLVYTLAKRLPDLHINPLDPYYDTLVKQVYDYAHSNYGWDSYDKIKRFADVYKQVGREKAHVRTGRSRSNLQRDYAVVYGNTRK